MASDFLNGLAKFLNDLSEEMTKVEQKQEVPKGDPVILTADKLKHMKWMSASQLGAIYHYGKANVKIDDDPKAYSELKWFSQDQLEAIFGTEEVKN